jgi:hypothetical protein
VVEYMGKIGLQQVHTEGRTLARGRQRGPAAALLVTPFRIPIPIAAYGWTGSTPTHKSPGQVVLVRANHVAEHLDSLVQSQGSSWSGKALLISSDPDKPMRAYSSSCRCCERPLLRAATAASGHCCARRRSASSRYPARRRYCSLGTASGSAARDH